MRTIKINFCDFWGDFNPVDNFIIRALRERYAVEISDNPDYLFFATFGIRHLDYKCVKIMFTGENLVPDFNVADYAMGFDWLSFGDRYMRLPLYLIRDNFRQLPPPPNGLQICEEEAVNRKFCSIVCSNAKLASPHRETFFKLLSQYKQVDSGGRLWNNVGGPVADKQAFLGQYKFNIAFENSATYGYTTEKILDAMTANSIPIYWGNPIVDKDFNPKAFINICDYASMEEAVKRVIELDCNNDLYMQMLTQPKVANPAIFHWQEELAAFLANIIEKPMDKAKYTTDYGMVKLHVRDIKCATFFGHKMKVYKLMAARHKMKERFHL